MAIFDLYSKKQKRLRGEVPDIYYYDKLPQELRVQIIYIINDALGEFNGTIHYNIRENNPYKVLHQAICREYGVPNLGTEVHKDEHYERDLKNFFLSTSDIEKAIDVIDLTFRLIFNVIKEDRGYKEYFKVKISPQDAVNELNERFKEHGFGFQFEGEIIRVDSTYSHSEIVKPVLNLLASNKMKGPNEEYRKAHEHYQHGRNKECLTECLKALESTMKVICNERKWAYNPTDTAKKLISICFTNGLIPTFTQTQFSSLISLIESGIPTLRNKLGGHGQGQVPQKVDDEIARYGLNLTGSNIIFLIENANIS